MDPVIDAVQGLGGKLKNNVTGTFEQMTPNRWIRLVVVLGAYILLRPYLIKIGERIQAKEHEKVLRERGGALAPVSANDLRGQTATTVPEDSESETEGATGADWGKKARRRQRKDTREALATDEKLRAEDDDDWSDPDVSDLLMG